MRDDSCRDRSGISGEPNRACGRATSATVPGVQAMLKKLTVRDFKSLVDVTVEFPRFAVLFGPNAAGKSNLLDAIAALSWIGNVRTLSDALDRPLPVRGHAFEAFSFPTGGLPALLQQENARFSLGADLAVGAERYRYRVEPSIELQSGRLGVADEYLALLGRTGKPKGTPAIERVDSKLHVRRKGKPAHPRQEPIGMNHAILSDRSLAGEEYRWLEAVRGELGEWCAHYLDPGLAMRVPRPPADVFDVGAHGEDVGPFLYKLRAVEPKRFDAVTRTLRSIVPGVESLEVLLDERRGTLDVLIRQEGVEYSSRIVSEGTLRVLALCAIAVNPWGGSLLAFEEPENGVHPRRLDLIARLLLSLASAGGRQVIVTTHSPLFCDAVLKHASSTADDVGLFNVRRVGQATAVEPFDAAGPLCKDAGIAAALTSRAEDGLFENLLLRGLIDE